MLAGTAFGQTWRETCLGWLCSLCARRADRVVLVSDGVHATNHCSLCTFCTLNGRYEVQLQGLAGAGPAPPASTTTSSPALPARLSVQIDLRVVPDAPGSISSGGGGGSIDAIAGHDGGGSDGGGAAAAGSSSSSRLYESPESAVEDAGALAGEGARGVLVQKCTWGEGPIPGWALSTEPPFVQPR